MPIIVALYAVQRNLLYGGYPREEAVVLVGSKKAIAIAVKNDAVSRRYTLATQLSEMLDTAGSC